MANDLTSDGGKPYKHTLSYSPPKGPIHQGGEGPGLRGGVNSGNHNTPTTHDDVAACGFCGQNHGNKGSQGSH